MEKKQILIIGFIATIVYILLWLLLALPHILVRIGEGDPNLTQFIVSLTVSSLCLLTSFHLWSRVPSLPEGPIRKLFLLTGITFIVLLCIFAYLLVDILLIWNNYSAIGAMLNSAIPMVEFDFFGIESLHTTMPAESFLTFGLIMLAISFYLYPMEKYVKLNSTPWHTLSMLVCIGIIPVLLLLVPRDVVGSTYIMSILTAVIVLWVVYNFIFLFYLYFSTGMKSPKGTAMRKASFMIGIGLLLIIVTWIAGWSLRDVGDIASLFAQMLVGGIAVVLFNYGFYLIRPD